jgi:UDP-N-acetyl-2-amino-2-deoxyglucuronate dehydrogenase
MAYNVGLIGGGNISDTHARAALEVPGVSISAVYGQNRSRVEDLARRYGGTPYSDLDSFLDAPGLDVVLIGSPSGLHAEQAGAAAKRGIHVLSEKPLDITVARIDGLLEECERAGVHLGVFFQDRMSGDIRWLKRLIEAGGLGTPLLATARVKWYRPPEYYASSRWRGTWALDGGGAVMNQGIHTVDLLLHLFGDVQSVFAQTRTALHDIEVEDTAVACLTFVNGAVGTYEATTAAFPGYPRRAEFTGSEGTVILEGDVVVATDLRTAPAEPPPGSQRLENPSANSATVSDVSGHRRVLENFLRSIDGTEVSCCGGRQGRRSVELVEAIYASARDSRPVRLGTT